MALIDNIVAYWKYDESSGNASDSTANSNTLTNNNTATFVAAVINNGADLERSSTQYFSATDSASLSVTGNLTINCWIKQETAGDNYMVAKDRYGTGADRGYLLYTDAIDRLNMFLSADAAGSTTGNTQGATAIGTTAFKMVSGVYNGTTIKVYINGVEDGTSNYSSGINDTAVDLFVGSTNNGGSPALFLDGIVDEMGIWARDLSSTELLELYNDGAGLSYPFTAPAIGGRPNNLALLGVS